MDNILIIGIDSLIGNYLNGYFRERGKAVLGTTRRRDRSVKDHIFLDLAETGDWQPPPGISAAIICASITSTRYCRENPEYSQKINVDSTLRIVSQLLSKNIFTVFLSTSMVFDGSRKYALTSDPVNPVTVYGRQKALVEQQLASDKNISIVRLSKVLSLESNPLLNWNHDLKLKKIINPFNDYRLAPISLKYLAGILDLIIENRYQGISHASGKYDISYADLGFHFAKERGFPLSLISPVSIKDSQVTVEFNPSFTALDMSRLEKDFNVSAPTVMDCLRDL